MEIVVSIHSFICLFICIMYTIEVHKTLQYQLLNYHLKKTKRDEDEIKKTR